jgi:hypothetical protein
VVDVDNAVAPDDSTLNDTPVVEDADKATAVTVAAVPKAAAGIAAVDAAPLHDAGTIEDEIRDGKNVQRIRYGDGWAWTRGGKIVRTADRDGKEVAYFRPGEGKPFFVQRGDRSYAYQGDKPVRSFDRNGRAEAPDGDRAREAADYSSLAAQTAGEVAPKATEGANPLSSGLTARWWIPPPSALRAATSPAGALRGRKGFGLLGSECRRWTAAL